MAATDTFLDASLLGFTKLGVSTRGLDVDEPYPEVHGKHVMVTGATGGIGRATALRLASNGAIVHGVGRSADKLAILEADTNGAVVAHQADLSSMEAINELTDGFLASGHGLHGIVNNVGVMTHERVTTAEGFELTYAVNLLGQYVLTTNLLPALISAVPSSVVMVSSGGMYSQPLTTTNMQSTEDPYDGTAAYARTKRGQVELAIAWAEAFADKDVRVNSMHPGWVDTEGVRTALPKFRKLTRPLLRDAAQGADSIVWLIASQDAGAVTGQFIHDRMPRPTQRGKRPQTDGALRKELMDMLATDAAPFITSGAINSQEDTNADHH
ncbi:MAG: SDR family NAD(P)-dependent oxidoreductase [Acidimicrobiia bacterium]